MAFHIIYIFNFSTAIADYFCLKSKSGLLLKPLISSNVSIVSAVI